MLVAVATLILAVSVMGCSDSMTNPVNESTLRNDNQVFNYRVTAVMQVTEEGAAYEDTIETTLFSVESVDGKILNPPTLEVNEPLTVVEGDIVNVWFYFEITNDRGVPQLATWIDDVEIQKFEGKKGEGYRFPVTVNTNVVTAQAELDGEVELWVRKNHPNFAQLLWGTGHNMNIVIEVTPKPVIEYETVYFVDETITSETGETVTLTEVDYGVSVGTQVFPGNDGMSKIRLYIKNAEGFTVRTISVDNSAVSNGEVKVRNTNFNNLGDGVYTYVIETDYYKNGNTIRMIDDVVNVTIHIVNGKIAGTNSMLVPVI